MKKHHSSAALAFMSGLKTIPCKIHMTVLRRRFGVPNCHTQGIGILSIRSPISVTFITISKSLKAPVYQPNSTNTTTNVAALPAPTPPAPAAPATTPTLTPIHIPPPPPTTNYTTNTTTNLLLLLSPLVSLLLIHLAGTSAQYIEARC